MSVLVAIARELREARAARHELERVRVTPAAIRCSPVSVPLEVERIHPRALEVYVRTFELVLHPADWCALKCERGLGTPYAVTVDITTGAERVMGLPVVRDPALTAP